jgi:hypothetical protein
MFLIGKHAVPILLRVVEDERNELNLRPLRIASIRVGAAARHRRRTSLSRKQLKEIPMKYQTQQPDNNRAPIPR